MDIREALFLSSQNKATYTRIVSPLSPTEPHWGYRVQAEIKLEECIPLVGAPYMHEVYEITVSRTDGKTVLPPHRIIKKYSIDECVEYLHTQMADEQFENPWEPVEVWEPEEEVMSESDRTHDTSSGNNPIALHEENRDWPRSKKDG